MSVDQDDDALAGAVRAELRAAREKQRLSFEELGERAGMLRGTVYRYLNGNGAFPLQSFFRLCRGLDVQPASVLTASEEALAAEVAARREVNKVDASVTVRELGRRLSMVVNVLTDGAGAASLFPSIAPDLSLDLSTWLALVEGRAPAVPTIEELSVVAEAVGVPTQYLTAAEDSRDVVRTDARLEHVRALQVNAVRGAESKPFTTITPAMLQVMTEPIDATG